jgi:hypothetical protein
MESTVQDVLLARVERLERQNTRLWGSLLAVAGLAILGLTGRVGAETKPATSDTIEARRFVLRDETGAKRGEWFVDGLTNGRLRLFGPDGKKTGELPFQAGAFLLER